MIVESPVEIPIGEIIEVHDSNLGGPTANGRVLRAATFEEYVTYVRLVDPEFEKYAHLYVDHPLMHHYEVSED